MTTEKGDTGYMAYYIIIAILLIVMVFTCHKFVLTAYEVIKKPLDLVIIYEHDDGDAVLDDAWRQIADMVSEKNAFIIAHNYVDDTMGDRIRVIDNRKMKTMYYRSDSVMELLTFIRKRIQ